MIYIIGDSHVSVFSGTDKTFDGLRHIQPEFGTCYTISGGQLRPHINRFEQRIPYFLPIKTGSNTAWNSYDKLPRIKQAIEEYGVTNDDYVFTCFGEIDIRNHIGFNLNGKDVFEVVNDTVDRYLKTILHLKDFGLNVGVYGAPPSSVGGPSFGRQYGDVILRNQMTIHFNEYLKTKCEENDVIFKDISKKLMLPDGTTDEKKFMMDAIHLSQGVMPFLKEEFNDLICKMEMI